MGRYIEWDDVIDRYPELNTLGGSDETSSAYIVYAEAFIDSSLSRTYTVPFSLNNMTVRDLVIDSVYFRAGRFKLSNAADVNSSVMATIKMINDGKLEMIDPNGNNLNHPKKAIGLFSTTESYHSSFGMYLPEQWHIDEDNITDEEERH